MLPTALAPAPRDSSPDHATVVAKGLIPPSVVVVCGPRDERELGVSRLIVEGAYLAAGGEHDDASGNSLTAARG